MKKSSILFLIILLVVAGLGYYFFSGKKQEKVSENKVNTTQEKQEEKGTVVEKIRDLVAQNVSLKCTYQIDESEITTYIKGKNKFRTIVETKQELNKSIFSMLSFKILRDCDI